ncbi:ATP-binding protein [Nocardia brasiliensis]|uniref:ATP-binding protein n=1 Tax=Nocardia brasiliensis TaxID=37326 RepID=UPI002457CBBA|nr:ATP-binding protein [Nocardia brasiliensis]
MTRAAFEFDDTESSAIDRLDANAMDLLMRVSDLVQRVQVAVSRRGPDNAAWLPGAMFGTPHFLDLLDAYGHGDSDRPTMIESSSRFEMLVSHRALTTLETQVLVIALAVDLDPCFEQYFGFLARDLSCVRPTIGVALELCGHTSLDRRARAVFAPTGRLLTDQLLIVDDAERSMLSRTLRVPDRLTAHLLGDDTLDPALAGVVHAASETLLEPSDTDTATIVRLAAAAEIHPLTYLRGGHDGHCRDLALSAAGRFALDVRLDALCTTVDPATAACAAVRETVLRGGSPLVAGPLQALPQDAADRARLLTLLCSSSAPVILYGAPDWDTRWYPRQPIQLTAASRNRHDHMRQWRRQLATVEPTICNDLAASMATYAFDATAIHATVATASQHALLEGEPLSLTHLQQAARIHHSTDLTRLTRRIEPAVGWDDLVVAPEVSRQLHELVIRAQHRDKVLGDWNMRPGAARGHGLTALFTGDSGTGKTLAAEVLAGALGVDLYIVDLATVIDKYIGETEKNLDRIFTAASTLNAVLLFDEADALFGKRSDVDHAHDRYANIEVAYLLQRMETFDGLAILTTNLATALDTAFTRRLDSTITFQPPDSQARRALWHRCLHTIPRESDINLDHLATTYEITGGNIRSAAITAAYQAAHTGKPLTLPDLTAAIHNEYRKLGRLIPPASRRASTS